MRGPGPRSRTDRLRFYFAMSFNSFNARTLTLFVGRLGRTVHQLAGLEGVAAPGIQGFRGPIYLTRASAELAPVMLESAVKFDENRRRAWCWSRSSLADAAARHRSLTVHWRPDCTYAEKITPANRESRECSLLELGSPIKQGEARKSSVPHLYSDGTKRHREAPSPHGLQGPDCWGQAYT